MSSADHNLSQVHEGQVPSAKDMRFGIVVSEWNTEVTRKLLDGAYNTLIKYEAKEKNIAVKWVPGSFELPLGAQLMAESNKFDAIICLGCVIQGETRHFDFICSSVSQAIMNLGLEYNLPFIFGVLTPNNQEQAQDRAGGKHGNKGDEAALTAIKMVGLQQTI
ncbi:MAG: 6,7-dimethyl-8-ribityllumazine synthase [Prevotellaceae bacterium]|jgi:6,7-dimethyl-8-ribityllumazine synthase|nr:6,7-dimethyl-8-ribityllumazine synthase [Prevotellaceae bacterium]